MEFLSFFLLATAGFSSACTSSSVRGPSSSSEGFSGWTDKFGDNQVIFCTDNTAVVVSDPNNCQQNMSKGGGCTELAVYISGVLKVETAGDKIKFLDKSGAVKHEATMTGTNAYTLNISTRKVVSLTRAPLIGDQATMAYLCK